MEVPLRDSVLYPVQYLQPEINKMYQKFWEPDGFVIYEDMEAVIEADQTDKKAINILFKMTPELAKHDKEFSAHARLAKIMIGYLKKHADVANRPLFWNAITDTLEMVKKKPKFVFGQLPKKIVPIYQEPNPSDTTAYQAIKEMSVTMTSTTAIEFAINMFEQQADGFKRVYQPILNFDNLMYGEDAEIVISRHPIDVDIVVIMFRMNSKAVLVDPKFDQTRILAEGIVKKMKKKTEDFTPHWLKLAAAVDTSQGRRTPILLVGAK